MLNPRMYLTSLFSKSILKASIEVLKYSNAAGEGKGVEAVF